MNNQIKTLVLAAIAATAAVGSAQAQQSLGGTYVLGDLVAGFTTGSGTDLILNLGLESGLANGQSWDISSLVGSSLPSNFGNLSTVEWGVVGAAGANFFGTGLPTPINGVSALNAVKTQISGLGSGFVGGFRTAAASTAGNGSWNNGTVVGGTSTFKGQYYNPNMTGTGTANLYSVANNNTGKVQLNPGTWTLSIVGGDDILTYGSAAVPEPATYGLLAGVGLLALSLRRQMARA